MKIESDYNIKLEINQISKRIDEIVKKIDNKIFTFKNDQQVRNIKKIIVDKHTP